MTLWKTIILLSPSIPVALAFAQTPDPGPNEAGRGATVSVDATPTQRKTEKSPNPPRPIDHSRAERGKAVYQRFCISCHGEQGDGHGYSAQWLDPRPRDFTRAIFKCRSTPSGTLPVDADLLRTLNEGLYHTNMPSWAVLGERQLRDVIETIKTFSPRWKEEGPGDPIATTPEPADDPTSRSRGKGVWNVLACFNCHGQTGKGDGPSVPTLFDDWGFHLTPFDFTSSPHRKCGNTDKDLYRTFLTGLDGTPMPSYGESV